MDAEPRQAALAQLARNVNSHFASGQVSSCLERSSTFEPVEHVRVSRIDGVMSKQRQLTFLVILSGLLVTLGLVPIASTVAAAAPPGQFVSVPYQRLVDTTTTGGAFSANETRSYRVTGIAGIPSTGVAAVVLDVEVTSTGFAGTAIMVQKNGEYVSFTPTVRAEKGTTPATNTIVVEPDSAGYISVNSSGATTQLNLDVQGYFTTGSGGGFTPSRSLVADTSNNVGFSGPLLDGAVRDLQITGVNGIPTSATSVFVNVIAQSPTVDGAIDFSSRSGSAPAGSQFSYSSPRTDAMGLIVPLDATGGFRLRNTSPGGQTGASIEVMGYFTPTAGSSEGSFTALGEPEVLGYVCCGWSVYGYRLAPGASVDFAVGGTNGMPTYGVGGAVLNIFSRPDSATGYGATGQVRVFPTGFTPPSSPTFTYGPQNGIIRDGDASVTTVVGTGLDGKVTIKNDGGSNVNLRVSVEGWFSGHRAIAQANEASYITNAVAAGTPSGVAKLAIWNAEIRDIVPQGIDLVTDTEQSGGVVMTAEFPESGLAPPAVPGDAAFVRSISTPTDGSEPLSYRAADGTCGSGKKLYSAYPEKLVIKSIVNVPLYWIKIEKRWCSDKSEKRIASVWANQSGDVYTVADTWIEDLGTEADKSVDIYMTAYPGKPRSGHLSTRVRTFRFCTVPKLLFCYNSHYTQNISAFWDGTFQYFNTYSYP
jgi:hypothetical protein